MANYMKLDVDFRIQLVECTFSSSGSHKPHTIFNSAEQLNKKCFYSNRTGEQFSADDLMASIAKLHGVTTIEQLIPDIEKARVLEEGRREFDITFPANFPPGDVELRVEGEKRAVDQATLKIHFHLWQKKQ